MPHHYRGVRPTTTDIILQIENQSLCVAKFRCRFQDDLNSGVHTGSDPDVVNVVVEQFPIRVKICESLVGCEEIFILCCHLDRLENA